ncbi:putative enzyme related to lactoylglutathione lyase [Kineococcus rhizosphaerae]|uniref:Putative enzyme related to lactoylglutathione lyase n=1 Tax=Kineococcus rhizosphaerae TaxID=559628 RepID=A0A2T0QZV1_9ACTN|nr:putative enzyme related to lactoylglutathione lyase [Kineococcus rhizosphaerae]
MSLARCQDRHVQRYSRGELVAVLDTSDLDRAAAFWTAVLGYRRDEYGGGPYLSLVPSSGDGVELLLQRTGDPKGGKNRMHLDLRTSDLEAEVARIEAAGGVRLTSEVVVEQGWRWHVLADPDGNELCVLQPPDD